MKKLPMTADEAREIVAAMKRETPKAARVRVLQIGIDIGNLSDAARDVYRAALAAEAA